MKEGDRGDIGTIEGYKVVNGGGWNVCSILSIVLQHLQIGWKRNIMRRGEGGAECGRVVRVMGVAGY